MTDAGLNKRLIEESRELARRIVRQQMRLAFAKYYLLWSTYPFALLLASTAIPSSPFLVYAVTLPVYLYFVGRVFAKAGRAVARLTGEKRSWKSTALANSLILGLVMLALYFGYERGAGLLNALAMAFVAALVDALLVYYLHFKLRDFRLTDLLAVITFSSGMAVTALSSEYPALEGLIGPVWAVYAIAWIYAGYASFMEVIEGE
ncbi:MAG: hypothetical protein ACP5HQ_04065 [Thermoprotei archaeon]